MRCREHLSPTSIFASQTSPARNDSLSKNMRFALPEAPSKSLKFCAQEWSSEAYETKTSCANPSTTLDSPAVVFSYPNADPGVVPCSAKMAWALRAALKLGAGIDRPLAFALVRHRKRRDRCAALTPRDRAQSGKLRRDAFCCSLKRGRIDHLSLDPASLSSTKVRLIWRRSDRDCRSAGPSTFGWSCMIASLMDSSTARQISA